MLQVYIGLLLVAVGTMGLIGVYRAMNKRTEVVRDYADIRREGILRFVAEYERPGSYVAVDDTALQGFQLQLSGFFDGVGAQFGVAGTAADDRDGKNGKGGGQQAGQGVHQVAPGARGRAASRWS